MNKLYNIKEKITNKIRDFLKINIPNLRKTQLNIIPEILFGMISSEFMFNQNLFKEDFVYFLIMIYLIQKPFFNDLITYVISKYSW